MDLLTLAQRVEGAAAEEQRELLIDAWDATGRLDPERPGQFAAWLAFERMLDAEAWESASLMLVPEGWTGCVFLSGRADLWDDAGLARAISGTAATPALAIVAAALKARASMETTDER